MRELLRHPLPRKDDDEDFSKKSACYNSISNTCFGLCADYINWCNSLSLPISSAQGRHQPFIDSLFVAASGISTTGLTPVDIGSYYSKFGQIVFSAYFR